ncbi:UPF0175 family protein [Endozoicomonas gorgoniicola]|uniref:UPF0175 family protein n=1 Tax=Endozoicomonas gorgoniicola TaxID=1234144 RepID=A0ABT3MUZ7_9GAMM|nr:UPF0175 family protein [Endozoicomonas gorgoniicola]MCW7553215.1 UPF0175 family protein [Endozoicomonas gorgoniicola]
MNTNTTPAVFGIRELRERSKELGKAAQDGKLTVLTRYGAPLMIGVPVTSFLLEKGVHTGLAVSLYESGALTLAKAAQLASLSLEDFMNTVSSLGIPIADYEPGDIEKEMKYFD